MSLTSSDSDDNLSSSSEWSMASVAAVAKVELDMMFYCVLCCVLGVAIFLEQVRITAWVC